MTESPLTPATANPGPLLIYTRVGEPARLKPLGRLLAALIGAICLTVLVIAVRLHPSPTGVASHTAMGFDECQFL